MPDRGGNPNPRASRAASEIFSDFRTCIVREVWAPTVHAACRMYQADETSPTSLPHVDGECPYTAKADCIAFVRHVWRQNV